MGLQIPNVGSGVDPNQSELDARDFEIIAAGFLRTGVISGCAVSQRAAGANLSVDVSAGRISLPTGEVAIAGTNVAITAPDATNPRFDLVVASSAGVVSVVAGTPAAGGGVPGPVFPAIPASSVVLAAVWVPAGDTDITNAQIKDRGIPLPGGPAAAAVVTDQSTTSTSFVDLATAGPTVSVIVGASGRLAVWLAANAYNSLAENFALMAFALSGANTQAASDNEAATLRARLATSGEDIGKLVILSGLTPGLTTVTAKYRAQNGTANFRRRAVLAVPL